SDISPLEGVNAYSVRAVKLETTPSGSYYNLSPGTRNSIAGLVKNGVAENSSAKDELQVIQTLNGIEIILTKKYTSLAKLEIFDASGKNILMLDDRTLSQGTYRYNWQTSSIPSGLYFVRAIGMKEPLTEKILVVN